MANGICQSFRSEDVVCSYKLRKRLFTGGVVDKADHNPSSTTSKDSFHGTGVSLVQYPSHTHSGTDRDIPVICHGGSSTKSVTPLPSNYTIVRPAAIKTKNFSAPAVQSFVRPSNFLASKAATEDEYAWLSKVKTAIEKTDSTMDGWIAWSAYLLICNKLSSHLLQLMHCCLCFLTMRTQWQ